ncbi:MAG: adenylate/guanylate cyclase domain-containing protein [Pirellulaceae bacterium]
MIATIEEVREFAESRLQDARDGGESIPFHLVERYQAKSFSANRRKEGSIEGSISIVDDPKFSVLKHGTGQLAWAVVLSVDLRHSTWRALEYGAKNTYLTMHTFLPTMEYLIGRSNGTVIGLRGDGLFAGFGITEVEEGRETFTTEIATKAAGDSVKCGRGMVEAIEDVINPLLEEEDIPAAMQIGVGIDSGKVIITRIGLDTANEVTAYGTCVNEACKRSSGNNEVYISAAVNRYYPSSDTGKVRFEFVRNKGYRVDNYPCDVLSRKHPGRPR